MSGCISLTCSDTNLSLKTSCFQSKNDQIQVLIRNIEQLARTLFDEKKWDTIQNRLVRGGRLTARECEDLVVNAAATDRLPVIKCLVSQNKKLRQSGLDKAVIEAVKKGHDPIVQCLLTQGRALSQGGLDLAVIEAARRGDCHMLEKLLGKTGSLSQLSLDAAVSVATRYLKVVRYLLSKQALSLIGWQAAVINALEKKDLDTAEFLLCDSIRKNEADIPTIVNVAIRCGYLNVASSLLSKCSDLSSEQVGMAILQAVKQREPDLAMIQLLVGTVRSLDQTWLQLVVVDCIVKGHLEVIKFLLKKEGCLSPGQLHANVARAIELNRVEISVLLLRIGGVANKEALRKLFMYAVIGGYLEEVKFLLLQDTTLDQTHELIQFIAIAAGNGHLGVVRFFFSKNEDLYVGAIGLDIITYRAVENDRLEILRFLLSENRTINQVWLFTLVEEAAKRGYVNVLEFLLSGRQINQLELDTAVLDAAVIVASEGGHLATVEFLLRQGPISEYARNSAMTNASGNERDSIHDILRQARIITPPQRPATFRSQAPVARGASANHELYINIHEVTHNPVSYLRTLFEEGLPSRIVLINNNGRPSPAVDLGGVFKQFITTLCETLVADGYLKETDEGFPIAIPGKEYIYQYLGRFVSLIHAANVHKTDKILTGYLFDAHFLELAKKLAFAVPQNSFRVACDTIVMAVKNNCILQAAYTLIAQPTQEHKKAYLESIGEDPLAEDKSLKEVVTDASEQFLPYYHAAESFLSGITKEFKNQLISTDVGELTASFQGKPITVPGVLQALRLARGAFSPYSQAIIETLNSKDQNKIQLLCARLSQEKEQRDRNEKPDPTSQTFSIKVDWLIETLALKNTEQEEDRQWLKQFVFAITGKKAMMPGMTLRLQESWREGLTVELHTCFNGLDLPKESVSRSNFLVALEIAIHKNDYNIA